MGLILLADAKRHVRIDDEDPEYDEDIAEKLMQAEAIIIDYIKRPDHGWTTETLPYVVKAAMLIMLAQLFINREDADITPAIRNLLRRSRDPALA